MMRSFSESKAVTLAAGATSSNVLNGTRLSPVLGDGIISLWVTASVAEVTMELLVQSDNVCKNFRVSDANRYPVKDEDWALYNIPVGKNEVIELLFTDTAGAGATVQYVVSFSPRGSRAGTGVR